MSTSRVGGSNRLSAALFACLLTIALALGCNVSDDGAGIQVGSGDDAGAGNNGNVGTGDAGDLDAGANNATTPDMTTSNDVCSAGDLSRCPDIPGAVADSCDTSRATPFCVYRCESGRADANDDLGLPGSDGCEAECTESNGGVEICDGLDNNCDGEVDEGFSVGDACSDGTGACEANGEIVCSDDGTSVCSVTAGTPENEVCDGLDNDCDGEIDEGNPGSGGACDTMLDGACAAGVESCVGGELVCEQSVQPQTEACGGNNTGDGVDNDCDGEIDEGCASCVEGETIDCYSGDPATEDVGACRGGIRTCANGQFGACSGEVTPTAEACNNVDDDCDGVRDEDFSNKGDACSVGTGACQSSGIFVCSSDGSRTTCNASAGNPSTEQCNGVDDDCDGSVDENLTRSCGTDVGICVAGTETCSGGQWGACSGATGPATEVCNGVDDDCDGSQDEGFGVGNSCSVGTGQCERSGSITCSNGSATCGATPGAPSPESCNGLDDDCDGSTDEDFSNLGSNCSVGIGACRRTGTYVCSSSGTRTTCNASPGNPAPGDLCGDGVDNDCDGMIDEGCSSNTCNGPLDCPSSFEECCYNQQTQQQECLPPQDPGGNQRLCVR